MKIFPFIRISSSVENFTGLYTRCKFKFFFFRLCFFFRCSDFSRGNNNRRGEDHPSGSEIASCDYICVFYSNGSWKIASKREYEISRCILQVGKCVSFTAKFFFSSVRATKVCIFFFLFDLYNQIA